MMIELPDENLQQMEFPFAENHQPFSAPLA